MMRTGMLRTGSQCLEGARRGTAWLLDQQTPDGNWRAPETGAIDAFYKGSWALSATGHAEAAHRLLNHVQACFLAGDGDFEPRAAALHIDVHRLYANAYVIAGAQKIERYELVRPALGFLLSQQDARHGGFYSIKTAPGGRERSDTMSTGMCGVACLATGRLAEARQAGAYLARMIELQPAPQERFLTTSNGAGDLVTDFAAEEENWRVVDVRLPGQRWYALGLPFAFLVLLYEATGEEQYAALARWFFDFQARGIDPWDVPSSGKAAWGCSLLYRLTGEKRYREIALHIADNLLEWQSAEGWLFPHAWRTQPQTHDCALFDVTAEFTLWLALVGANVLARDGD